MTIEKPTGAGAEEIIGDSWPTWDEDAYSTVASTLMVYAATAQKAAKYAGQGHQYATTETTSATLDEVAEQLGIHVSLHQAHASGFAKSAGWVRNMASAIEAAKNGMKAAVEQHADLHKQWQLASKTGGLNDAKAKIIEARHAADVLEKRGTVATLLATMEFKLDAGEVALANPNPDEIADPPGGTPEIDERYALDENGQQPGLQQPAPPPRQEQPGGLPQGAPTGTMPGTPPAGGMMGGVPLGAPAPAAVSEGPGAPAAAPGAPGAPGAPAAASAPAPAPAAAPASFSPSSMGGGEGSGASDGAGSGAPMGGMPMSGMPMGGQPQGGGQPGGGQTPGGDVAKTVGDTVSKLAGKDGQPISEDDLDKLLEAQGDDDHDGAGGDHKAPDGDKDGLGPDGAKLGGDGAQGTHTQLTGPQRAVDPYSAANTNPTLNNPGPPSPASPAVTPPPVHVSAPMTELSADEHVPATQSQAPQQGADPASVATHTAAATGDSPVQSATGGATTAPGSGASTGTGGALGAYPGGAPMMGPGMGAGGGGGAPGGGSPVFAAPPSGPGASLLAAAAVPAGAAAVAGGAHRRADGGVAVEPDYFAELTPERQAADMHLAGLDRVFTSRGWAATPIAVGVFVTEDSRLPAPVLRYIMATADGLSLLPLSVPAPTGVELLDQQPLSGSFMADWGGGPPGRKLAAYAKESEAGQLVYLVSNDERQGSDLIAGLPGGVTESVRPHSVLQALAQTGRASAATQSRATIPGTMRIPADKLEETLTLFGQAWGFDGDDDEVTLAQAAAILWTARWDHRRGRNADYPAILATYLYLEGLEALRQGRDADANYSTSAMAVVEPITV